MLPPQEESKQAQMFRGKRNMRSLYYNTNGEIPDFQDDESQQSKPNLPRNAHVATGNGQLLLQSLFKVTENTRQSRRSPQDEYEQNYLVSKDVVRRIEKHLIGMYTAQSIENNRTGSKTMGENTSQNRLVTQGQTKEDLLRKTVVSPDIQSKGHPYRVIKQNQVNFSQSQYKSSQKSLQQSNEYRDQKTQSSLERQLIEIQRGKNSSNSAMSHIGPNGEKKNIYQQNMPFVAPRAQIASSQLTTYNRIANIGKLNKLQGKNVVQKPNAQSSTQQMKGKFYQTQVLKNKEKSDPSSYQFYNQTKGQSNRHHNNTNTSSQVSFLQKSLVQQPSTQEQSTTQLLDGSGLLHQMQNGRTNSLENIQPQPNLNLSNQKQYSIQKKNVVYRPPSAAKKPYQDEKKSLSIQDNRPYAVTTSQTNKNQLRLKVMPKNSTIDKNDRPLTNSQMSQLSQNSIKQNQPRQVNNANLINSYQNQDVLIFPPKMITQPVQKNEMNASAPLNIQQLRQTPTEQPATFETTIQNTIEEKQKRPLSNKIKKKLPAKLNKQLLGSIISNDALNKSQLIDKKPQPVVVQNINQIKQKYIGVIDQNSVESLPRRYDEEENQVPSKSLVGSYISTGQKVKNKTQGRQRPMSSTGRMKSNMKIMKSDKKLDEEEESEEDQQMELLNQLQQLNLLDQAQMSSQQLNQFQELLRIKEDLQANIAQKQSFGSTMTTTNLKMTGNIQVVRKKKKTVQKFDLSNIVPAQKSKTALNSYVTTFGATMLAEALKATQANCGDSTKKKSLSKQKTTQQNNASQKEIFNRGMDQDLIIMQEVADSHSSKNKDYQDNRKKPKTAKSQSNNKKKLNQTDQFRNLKNINDYTQLVQNQEILQIMHKLQENEYRSKSQLDKKNLNLTQPLSKLLSKGEKRQGSIVEKVHDEYQNFTDQIIEGEFEQMLNSSQQDNLDFSQLLEGQKKVQENMLQKRLSGQGPPRPQSNVEQQISKQVSKVNGQRKRSNSRQSGAEKKIPPTVQKKDPKINHQKRLSINSQNSNGIPLKQVVNPVIATVLGTTPAANGSQLSTKKYKISKTTKNQGGINFSKQKSSQNNQQQILSLLNFYNKTQNQKQIPTKNAKPVQKKLMTQKLQKTQLVNDIYLKVMKNSIMGNSSIASGNGSQKHKRVAKRNQQNSQEEVHYFGGSVEVEEIETVAKQHPLSLEHTSGPTNLRENLRNANNANLGSTQAPRLQIPNFDFNNYHQANTNIKQSLMGTIKGGIGIMQNLSSEIQTDSIDITNGKILNIENVLKNKHIFQEIQQQSEEDDEEVSDIANEANQVNTYEQDYTDSNNKTQPLPQEIIRAVAEIGPDKRKPSTGGPIPESSQLRKKLNSKQVQEPPEEKKVSQLDLKDDDRAGSRVPCSDTFIPLKERPENKKRVEYMNRLKEELDDKIKQRYTNLQQKNTLSQSNNLILIDHNSAYNPSQVGDDGDSSQMENRVQNYMFKKQIGEGAYAVVRLATSRENNEQYAVKVYDKTKLSDINRQRSVRREVVLLQKMNHPNIVKLVEAFETESHVYLVMENVSGGSLHSYLKQMINKQLEEEEARRIISQILVALKYCHSKCIAHRDIKLENILLDENKNVKLIDFGFSTCIPNHKKLRMFCGTPSYMAPQIVSKVEYAGPPADIWATGVLLYALLNGCFPFRGQTDDDLYRRIKRGTYHLYNQKVTREYTEVLQRCLDVNDDTRPTAQDLLEDPWFKIQDLKQRAYDEEKRQFKARILAKVPLIQKTNQTICILAQKNELTSKKEESKEDEKTDKKKQIHILNESKPNFPYANNKDDLVISDYGLHSGMALDKEREKEKQQTQHFGPRENYPMTINLNQQNSNTNLPSSVLNQIAPIVPTAHCGAIVLSYGAALAPQIQINNINNLHLINTNMKKKLNHEAYQAYYNTSSANNCINIGLAQNHNSSSPIANQDKPKVPIIQNVYGQSQPTIQPYEGHPNSPQVGFISQGNLLGGEKRQTQIDLSQPNDSDPSPVQQQVQVTSSYNLSGSEGQQHNQNSSSHGQTMVSAENLIHIDENNMQYQQYNLTNVSNSQRSKSRAVSIQYSPYSSAYHNQIVNNQMAQLHQLQQEHLREQQLKQASAEMEFDQNIQESHPRSKIQLNISTPGN